MIELATAEIVAGWLWGQTVEIPIGVFVLLVPYIYRAIYGETPPRKGE